MYVTMGVIGLTTYVEGNQDLYLKDHKLHGCVVLIDGNCVLSRIYSDLTDTNHAFGGDYDRYKQGIVQFVLSLQKCDIRPIFILDGGYERRKFKTVMQRMKTNVRICGQYRDRFKESKCFPLLLKEVFRITIRDFGLPLIQCDFEADQELVTTARLLNCPVISYDSDFYLNDVIYIPFNTIELSPLKLGRKDKKSLYYICCKLYKVDNLLNHFGGLENKTLLPLMSSLLGNDYIPQDTFYKHLALGRVGSMKQRLLKIVQWLRNISSVDNGLDQMLLAVNVERRKHIRSIVKRLIQDDRRKSSDIFEYIPDELFLNMQKMNTPNIKGCAKSDNSISSIDNISEEQPIVNIELDKSSNNQLASIVSNNENTFSDCDGECASEKCDIIIVSSSSSIQDIQSDVDETDDDVQSDRISYEQYCRTKAINQPDEEYESLTLKVPQWMFKNLRTSLLSPFVTNIVNAQQMFLNSQPEDYSLCPSHEICLPIWQVICGLILNDGEPKVVKCYARVKDSTLGTYEIIPKYSTELIPLLPTLYQVPKLSVPYRASIIADIAGISRDIDLNMFSDDWVLFVLSLTYWAKNCKTPQVNNIHIRAIIICSIYLQIIDQRVGFIRNRRLFRKKYKERLESLSKLRKNVAKHSCLDSLDFYLEAISTDDCILAVDSLLDYHQLNSSLLQNRKSFNIRLVHAFAQLQNCLRSMIVLNSVLNFPFNPCDPCKFLTCTFLYNIYNNLCLHQAVDEYVTRTLFSKASSIISLYRYLVNQFDNVLSLNVDKVKPKSRTRAKKKRNKFLQIDSIVPKTNEDVPVNEDSYFDPNNIYSLLSNM